MYRFLVQSSVGQQPILESRKVHNRSPGWKSTRSAVGIACALATICVIILISAHTSRRGRTAEDRYRSINTEEDDMEMAKAMDAINKMNARTPPPPALSRETCHTEEHSELDGRVVKWGADHFKETAGDCCAACMKHAECNVWVWCASPGGCGGGRAHKECWLKQNTVKNVLDSRALASHPGVAWTSGALYKPEEALRVAEAERLRLEALRDDANLPLVFLDVAIKGQAAGRVKIALLANHAPRAAENFRALVTGEKGVVPEGREGAGRPYHLKGASFYRIIDRFLAQTGANTESVFGGPFKDDPGGLALKHDRKGLLSMANAGPDTNTSHFSIMLAPAPHLDGHYTIFGEVVEGMEVIEKVNALARGKPNNSAGPEEGAVIVDCGQLR